MRPFQISVKTPTMSEGNHKDNGLEPGPCPCIMSPPQVKGQRRRSGCLGREIGDALERIVAGPEKQGAVMNDLKRKLVPGAPASAISRSPPQNETIQPHHVPKQGWVKIRAVNQFFFTFPQFITLNSYVEGYPKRYQWVAPHRPAPGVPRGRPRAGRGAAPGVRRRREDQHYPPRCAPPLVTARAADRNTHCVKADGWLGGVL